MSDRFGEFVSVEVDDAIAVIRIDRPKMNALNGAIRDGLRDAARSVTADEQVRAAIVWGGERVFAAGADIKEMEQYGYAEIAVWGRQLQDAFRELAAIPKPTVAAVEGYALGGGMELSMTCDFRIAASNATFGQPEILLGIIPGAGGTQRLARLVGPAKAKDLVFSGRFVPAQEALQIGLVDELVEPGEVLAAAKAKLAPYANGPALALRAAKEAIDRGLDVDLDTGLAMETALFAGLFGSDDQRAGMASFVANGPGKATFTGR